MQYSIIAIPFHDVRIVTMYAYIGHPPWEVCQVLGYFRQKWQSNAKCYKDICSWAATRIKSESLGDTFLIAPYWRVTGHCQFDHQITIDCFGCLASEKKNVGPSRETSYTFLFKLELPGWMRLMDHQIIPVKSAGRQRRSGHREDREVSRWAGPLM